MNSKSGQSQKILQIIPAPENVVVVYRDDENGELFEDDDLLCLALVECQCEGSGLVYQYLDGICSVGMLVSETIGFIQLCKRGQSGVVSAGEIAPLQAQ